MPDDSLTLEQRAVEAIKTLPLPSQNATDAENYRRFLNWLYRGSTQESVAALVIDLEFGVPTDGESDVERLLTVLRFIAQDPKTVSPVKAARDALADYGDQHATE